MGKYQTPQDLIFGSLKNKMFSNKICIDDELTNTTITYSGLDRESALAASLFRNFRIQRGNTISLLLENGLHFFAPWLGAMRMGAVVHPMNCLYAVKVDELLHAMELCETKLLVMQERYAWDKNKNEPSNCLLRIRKKFPNLKILIMHDPLNYDSNEIEKGACKLGTYGWSRLIKYMWSYDHVALLGESDTFQLICTSGTTGPPKAVVQHCGMFEPNVRDLISTYKLTGDDRTLLVNRLFHVNAQVTNFFPMVLLGGTVVLGSPKPEDILKTIEIKKITYSSMIPPMLSALYNHQLENNKSPNIKEQMKTLPFIIAGADILTPSLHKSFTDLFGVTVLPGWGMTETLCWGTGTALNTPNYWGSIGRALHHTQVKIVDPENNWEETNDNQWGRLIVRGDNIFYGYYRNKEATKKAFAPSEKWGEGWFDTGDTCRITYKNNGPLFFGWRSSADSWKVRGEFVQGPEIDEFAKKNPGVEDAMAVPVTINNETETALCVLLKKNLIDLDDSFRRSIAETAMSLYCEKGRQEGKLPLHVKINSIVFVENIELGDTGKRSRKKMAEIAQKYIDSKQNNQTPTA